MNFYRDLLRFGVGGIVLFALIAIPLFAAALPILIPLAIVFVVVIWLIWIVKGIVSGGKWLNNRVTRSKEDPYQMPKWRP